MTFLKVIFSDVMKTQIGFKINKQHEKNDGLKHLETYREEHDLIEVQDLLISLTILARIDQETKLKRILLAN